MRLQCIFLKLLSPSSMVCLLLLPLGAAFKLLNEMQDLDSAHWWISNLMRENRVDGMSCIELKRTGPALRAIEAIIADGPKLTNE